MLNCASTEDGRDLTDVLLDQLYLIHNHLSLFWGDLFLLV